MASSLRVALGRFAKNCKHFSGFRTSIDPKYSIRNTKECCDKILCGQFFSKGRGCNVHARSGCSSVLFSAIPGLLAAALFTKSEDEKKEKSVDQLTEKQLLAKLKKEDPLILLLKKAKLAEKKREFPEANTYYHQALNMLADYEKNDTWAAEKCLQAKVFIFDSMANLEFMLRNFENAEKLFKETMKGLLQQGLAGNDNAIVEISLKLAMIYAIEKRDADAERGYCYCVETQEQKIREMDEVDDNTMALLGLCMDSYSRFLIAKKDYKKAQENLQKALTIAEKVFTKIHPQVAVIHNDIATVASLQGDYQLAYESAKRAVEVAEKCESPHLATMYANYGSACIYQSLFDEAKKSCEKSLRMSKKINDKSNESLSQACLDAIQKQKQ